MTTPLCASPPAGCAAPGWGRRGPCSHGAPPRSRGFLPVYATASRGPQAPHAAAAAQVAGTAPATPPAAPTAASPSKPTTYLPGGNINWQALYAHLTFAAAPRVEAADALAHCKWEAADGTLTQQQLWERVRDEAREVAAEGEALQMESVAGNGLGSGAAAAWIPPPTAGIACGA